MPQVKYTADGLPYYDATDQQTQPYFPQVSGPMLPAPGNPAQPSEGWNQGVRDTLHGMTIGPVQDAAKALQGGMTPNEAQDFAFGAALGLLPMGRGLRPATQGIRAYHGSPHDFDRFDMSKIGTGEGAQAYGHGLYFAEAEPVARQYRDVLSGKVDPYQRRQLDDAWVAAARMMRSDGMSEADTFQAMRGAYKTASDDELKAAIQAGNPGRMYEVNINAHPDQFLDWDKPLVQQSPEVRTAFSRAAQPGYKSDPILSELFGNEPIPNEYLGLFERSSGGQAYNTLAAERGGPAQFSQALKEAGIPGIKYLDQGSRGPKSWVARHPQGGVWEHPDEQSALAFIAKNPDYTLEPPKQSLNYVVNNDKLIDIIKKYGLAALGLPPAMTAGSQIWNSQTQH
jgi:hypothetical protein